MQVLQLTHASQQNVDDINALLVQLRGGEPSSGTLQEVERIVNDPSMALVVAEEDGRIFGMGMVYVWSKVGKGKAFIEDVVVNELARGKGLGSQIMERLVAFAREKEAKSIVLNSNPDRKAAHGLYKKLGFEIQQTSPFRLKL